MTRSDHDPLRLSGFHLPDGLEVGRAGPDGVIEGADRVRVAAVRPKTRRRLELEARPGRDDEVVAVDAGRISPVGSLSDDILLIRMDLGCGTVDEVDMLRPVHRRELKGRLGRIHRAGPDPHTRGYLAEVVALAPHRDLVRRAELVAEIQGRRMTGKAGSDDDNVRPVGNLPFANWAALERTRKGPKSPGLRYMRSMMAVPNSLVLTSVAPSMRRAKSYVTILSAIAASMPLTIRSAASSQPM